MFKKKAPPDPVIVIQYPPTAAQETKRIVREEWPRFFYMLPSPEDSDYGRPVAYFQDIALKGWMEEFGKRFIKLENNIAVLRERLQ